jgi:hypothetical protein
MTRQLREAADQVIDLPAPGVGFQSGVYVPLNDVVLGDTGGARLVMTGNLAVSWADSTFEGTLTCDDEVEQVDAGVSLSGAATLEIAVDAGADVSGVVQLVLIPLPSFTVGGSLTVSPFVQVRVRVDVTADADARISVVAPFGTGSGFSYDGSTAAATSTPPRYVPEVGLPDVAIDLSGSIALEVVLALLIQVGTVPVGGPVLGASFGVILDVDSTAGWDVDGSIEVGGDWTFPDPATPTLPGIPEHLTTLHGPDRFDIPGASGPLPGGGVTSTRWSRVFDIANDDGAAAALPAGDGLIVVESGPNPWLAKLDALGVPCWQHTSADPWTPTGLVYAADGGILAAGTRGNSMRVDRFDPCGQPLWTRTLAVSDAATTTCTAVVQTAAGATILAGQVTRSAVRSPILAAVDADGDVEWSIEVDTGTGSTNSTIAALALSSSGGIIAVGSVGYADSGVAPELPIGGTNALILRLDTEGTLLGGYALGGTAAEEALRIVVHPDGTYAIGGHIAVAPQVWIASMSADDTVRWSASYQNRPDGAGIEFANPTGLAALDGNGMLVSGYIGAPDVDAFLMRVADNGMPVWVKTYAGVGTNDALSGVVARSDGLIAFGRTTAREDTGSRGDLWVIRGNVDAMVHFTPDSGLTTMNTDVQWRRIHDHTVRALTLRSVPSSLVAGPAVGLVVDPAGAVGELVTG